MRSPVSHLSFLLLNEITQVAGEQQALSPAPTSSLIILLIILLADDQIYH